MAMDSKVELLQAKQLGVDSEEIFMANPCKQISHLQTAKEHGVKMMVFDNEDELKKLKKYHPTSRLVLRIHVQEDGKINYFSLKYGATTKKARDLILMAKEFHMDVVGISFHVGALLGDKSDQYKRALLDAKELFDFAEKNNISFSLLDIGGGFRVTDPFLQQTTSSINIILEELFPVLKHPDLEIISEPGAFLTDTAFTLATNVIGRREIEDFESTYHYYVNDGKFGSFFIQFMLNRDMGYFFISEIWEHILLHSILVSMDIEQKHFMMSFQKKICYFFSNCARRKRLPVFVSKTWNINEEGE
ncbi:ornithine decarboxylase-like isoform X2 [Styela clava]